MTKQKIENEINELYTIINELKNEHQQLETSFMTRVQKIKDKMYGDYMMRRKIYENRIEKLTEKVVRETNKKFSEGMIISKYVWGDKKVFGLISKIRKEGGFEYNVIGVSGVGTKIGYVWFEWDKDDEIEIVCNVNDYVGLCKKYDISKPKLNKENIETIYENLFGKKVSDRFSINDLSKYGIVR